MLSSQESNVSELGRLLFKNSFTHVVHFTGTGRFLPSSSGQSLVSILTSMREGRPLSEDLWTALQARQVNLSHPFSTEERQKQLQMHWGSMAWEQTARLQQVRALMEGQALGKTVYYAQAVDMPTGSDVLTEEHAKKALQVVNMGGTGYLMGMCPLYIGMPVRTSANVEDVVLTRELACVVRRIELHPLEPMPDPTAACVILKYHPLAVLVECEDPEYRQYSSAAGGAPPGHFWIRPMTAATPWVLRLEKNQKVSLKRRQAWMSVLLSCHKQ